MCTLAHWPQSYVKRRLDLRSVAQARTCGSSEQVSARLRGAMPKAFAYAMYMESRVIKGAHIVIYSTDSEADRAFFRQVLQFSSVDAGDGWLIFAMPPLEAAFHESDHDQHALYLMCDDIAGRCTI